MMNELELPGTNPTPSPPPVAPPVPKVEVKKVVLEVPD
jgi:hypothetical protein